jgi:perosamine synthetase
MTAHGWIVPYRPRGTTFGAAELAALESLLAGEETLSCGPQRDAFEAEFAAAIGVKNAVALTNCTVALEFASRLIGFDPGDQVVAVSQTYHATVQPLLDLDVVVRFCDIDRRTGNVDCDHLESLVGPRTRAVYVVHHGGLCVDLAALGDITSRHGLRVVEDCAHALPSTHRGQHAGTIDLGCFSFQSYKNLSTLGEGGMLSTADSADAERARLARAIEPVANYAPRRSNGSGRRGIADRRVFWHHRRSFERDCTGIEWAGTNSTLAEPACAVGRVQLERLGEMTSRRRSIATAYDEAIGGIDGVELLSPAAAGDRHAHHLYTFRLRRSAGARDALLSTLVDDRIEIQQRYFPVHLMPEWRLRSGECELPATEQMWFEEQVQLPIYPQMTDAQVEHVIDSVARALNASRPQARGLGEP